MFTETTEREKMELVETHATELAKLWGDMDLETHSYTEYLQNVHRQLHELHKMVASSFNEVQAWCLPFPREVKTVPDTVWQLNDNFTILVVEGILSMLNNKGSQELGRLHRLAASSDAAILQDVPEDVWKLAGWIVRKWWKSHGLLEALHRLEAANAMIVSDTDSGELMSWIANWLIKW
jgi:hypothetical protein